MPTSEQIRSTVDADFAPDAKSDTSAFLALWASNGVLEDPAGMPAHVRVEALGAFWDGARRLTSVRSDRDMASASPLTS